MSCSRPSSARHPICAARRRAASISNMRRRSAFGSIRRLRRRHGSTLCWRASARPWSGRARTTMARARRKGRPIHGWLSLDKPEGMTSTEAVAHVRRITQAEKAGHGGTLDPLATGVLPIALGEATKTVAWAMAGRKTYRFTLRWGEARDTDDAEGRVTAESAMRPDAAAIEAALDDIPALALTETEAHRLRCGQTVTPLHTSDQVRIDQLGDGTTVCAT